MPSVALGAIAASGITLIADKASSANTYFTGGAALCAILAFIGVPLWRAVRKATAERRHQTSLLAAMHDAIFGTPQRVEGGVVIEEAAEGVRHEVANLKTSVAAITAILDSGTPLQARIAEKLDDAIEATNDRLDRHDEQIAAARKAAGEAAVHAAALAERMTMLNERWWEWINDMQARNEAHEAALHELGIDVGTLPPPDDRTDDAERHRR